MCLIGIGSSSGPGDAFGEGLGVVVVPPGGGLDPEGCSPPSSAPSRYWPPRAPTMTSARRATNVRLRRTIMRRRAVELAARGRSPAFELTLGPRSWRPTIMPSAALAKNPRLWEARELGGRGDPR